MLGRAASLTWQQFHFQCPPLGLDTATATDTKYLVNLALNSSIDNGDGELCQFWLDVPSQCGYLFEVLQNVVVEDLLDEGLSHKFPVILHSMFGSANLSVDPTSPQGDWWTALLLSLPECTRHMTKGCLKQQQSWLSTSCLGCPGITCSNRH